jgi:hypothetical protein
MTPCLYITIAFAFAEELGRPHRDLFSESREQMDDDYAIDISGGARRAN